GRKGREGGGGGGKARRERSAAVAMCLALQPAVLAYPKGGQPMTETTPPSGYAPVNGISLYYEIHGTGQPLVLLHGGLGAIEMFGEVLPRLAPDHQVIAVHPQDHGPTADADRPLRYAPMADRIAAM